MIDAAEIDRQLKSLRRGFLSPVSEFTLAVAPATTTTVTSRGCSSGSVVLTMPMTANAAAAGVLRIVPGKEEFVVHHSSSAQVDRTFRYVILTGT
jgi:hypothetical protein